MTQRIATLLAGVFAGATLTAHAHHSWSVDYDTEQRIVVEGVVTEFLRLRPHSALLMDVENPDGEIEQWTVEYGRGFVDSAGREYEPQELKPGDVLTVTGQPHRNPGANHVRLRSVVREGDGLALEPRRRNRDGRGRRGRDR